MANGVNGKKSMSGAKILGLSLLSLGIISAIFLGFIMYRTFQNQTQPNYVTIEEQANEIAKLEAENDLLRNGLRVELIKDIAGKVAMVAAVIGLFGLFMYYRYKKESGVLELDEAREKYVKRAEEITGEKVIWSTGNSFEKVVGKRVYLLSYRFYQKPRGRNKDFWYLTKFIVVDPQNHKFGRIEDIPQGTSLTGAIRRVLHELDMQGYSLMKDDKTLASELVKSFAAEKKAERDVLEVLE